MATTMEMTPEIQMLAWASALGLVQLVLDATLGTAQRGLKWNVSARDGEPAPLTGVAARVHRAFLNFLETFPFFVAAVLAVALTGRANAATALGVQLYFWARVVYVPLYAAGIPYVRTLTWAVSLVGLLKVLAVLF
jgi:uncharacterized MAPEG superfamily protein